MESEDFEQRQIDNAAAEAAGIGGDTGEPEYSDPAERAVREGGGGEAEGFEESEGALIEHAEHGDLGHSLRGDFFPGEAESDRSGAEYGDADSELVEPPDRDDEEEDR